MALDKDFWLGKERKTVFSLSRAKKEPTLYLLWVVMGEGAASIGLAIAMIVHG